MKKTMLTLLTTCFWLTLLANDPLLTGTPIGSPAVDYNTGHVSTTENQPSDAFGGDMNTF